MDEDHISSKLLPQLSSRCCWGVPPMHTIIGSTNEWTEWCDTGSMSIILDSMTAVIGLFDNTEIVLGADGGMTLNGNPWAGSPMCKLTRLNDSCCLAWAGRLNDIIPLFADLIGQRELSGETEALNLWLESGDEVHLSTDDVSLFLEERMPLLDGAIHHLPPEMGVTVLLCSRDPLNVKLFQASGGQSFARDLPITDVCQHFMKIPNMKNGSLEQLQPVLYSPRNGKEDSIVNAIRFVASNTIQSKIVSRDVSLASSLDGFAITWHLESEI
jgi:hypothetical protein